MKKYIFVSALMGVLLFGCSASRYEYPHMQENYKIGNYWETSCSDESERRAYEEWCEQKENK